MFAAAECIITTLVATVGLIHAYVSVVNTAGLVEAVTLIIWTGCWKIHSLNKHVSIRMRNKLHKPA
jgi:hypothetical protein